MNNNRSLTCPKLSFLLASFQQLIVEINKDLRSLLINSNKLITRHYIHEFKITRRVTQLTSLESTNSLEVHCGEFNCASAQFFKRVNELVERFMLRPWTPQA